MGKAFLGRELSKIHTHRSIANKLTQMYKASLMKIGRKHLYRTGNQMCYQCQVERNFVESMQGICELDLMEQKFRCVEANWHRLRERLRRIKWGLKKR